MRRIILVALALSILLSACGPGKLFGPTNTPTLTPNPTRTPTPTWTPRPTTSNLAKRNFTLPNLWESLVAPVFHSSHRTLPSVHQLRSHLLKRISLHASDHSRRLPLRFPPACHSSPLAPILSLLLPPNSEFCTFLTCQRPLSECTILYMIGAVCNPVRLSEIQSPNHWPLVPLRAA